MGQIRCHGLEISIVDTQKGVAGVRKADVILHAVQTFNIMDLKQNSQAKFDGENLIINNVLFGQAFGDQQNCVGASRSTFPNLPTINNKIFSQNRERNRFTNAFYEIQMSTKVVLIGQATNGCSASLVIALGNVHGIKIIANKSGGRALLFNFRYDTNRFRAVAHNGAKEISRTGHRTHLVL